VFYRRRRLQRADVYKGRRRAIPASAITGQARYAWLGRELARQPLSVQHYQGNQRASGSVEPGGRRALLNEPSDVWPTQIVGMLTGPRGALAGGD
jgi:hypothetical protein